MSDDELMSTRDVARALGVSIPTVTRRARDGELPAQVKAPGVRGAYMFKRQDIDTLVAERAR